MTDVRVHVRRLVVDAGAEGLDARTLPAAIAAALSDRLDTRRSHQEPRVPSTSDAIADAIATHVVTPTPRTGATRG